MYNTIVLCFPTRLYHIDNLFYSVISISGRRSSFTTNGSAKWRFGNCRGATSPRSLRITRTRVITVRRLVLCVVSTAAISASAVFSRTIGQTVRLDCVVFFAVLVPRSLLFDAFVRRLLRSVPAIRRPSSNSTGITQLRSSGPRTSPASVRQRAECLEPKRRKLLRSGNAFRRIYEFFVLFFRYRRCRRRYSDRFRRHPVRVFVDLWLPFRDLRYPSDRYYLRK